MNGKVDAIAVVRTNVQATLVGYRIQTLTLMSMINRRLITPASAAAIVRESAEYLTSPGNSPQIELLYAEVLEEIAVTLENEVVG